MQNSVSHALGTCSSRPSHFQLCPRDFRRREIPLAVAPAYTAPMGLCWWLLLAFLALGLKCLGVTVSVHLSRAIKLQPLNCQRQRQLGRKVVLSQFIVLGQQPQQKPRGDVAAIARNDSPYSF